MYIIIYYYLFEVYCCINYIHGFRISHDIHTYTPVILQRLSLEPVMYATIFFTIYL